jgi:hypothetical protein
MQCPVADGEVEEQRVPVVTPRVGFGLSLNPQDLDYFVVKFAYMSEFKGLPEARAQLYRLSRNVCGLAGSKCASS